MTAWGNRKWVLVIRGNFTARRVAGAGCASVRKALWELFLALSCALSLKCGRWEKKGSFVDGIPNAKDQLGTHTQSPTPAKEKDATISEYKGEV